MTELKRHCEFIPGYDKRNSNPSKNYGISGGRFMFVVSGEKGLFIFPFLQAITLKAPSNTLLDTTETTLGACAKVWRLWALMLGITR